MTSSFLHTQPLDFESGHHLQLMIWDSYSEPLGWSPYLITSWIVIMILFVYFWMPFLCCPWSWWRLCAAWIEEHFGLVAWRLAGNYTLKMLVTFYLSFLNWVRHWIHELRVFLSSYIGNLLNPVSLFEVGNHSPIWFSNCVFMCFFVFISVCLLLTLILLLYEMANFELKFLNQDGDSMFWNMIEDLILKIPWSAFSSGLPNGREESDFPFCFVYMMCWHVKHQKQKDLYLLDSSASWTNSFEQAYQYWWSPASVASILLAVYSSLVSLDYSTSTNSPAAPHAHKAWHWFQ